MITSRRRSIQKSNPLFAINKDGWTLAALLTLLIGAQGLAGSPPPFQHGEPAPNPTTGTRPAPEGSAIVLRSFGQSQSLPDQLYRALRLAKSDVLIKTADRVSLEDPRANFQLICSAHGTLSCSFTGLSAGTQSELGWAVSEVSAQAILFQALDSFYANHPANPTLTRDEIDAGTIRYSLKDARTKSLIACAKRDGATVEFNCRFYLHP